VLGSLTAFENVELQGRLRASLMIWTQTNFACCCYDADAWRQAWSLRPREPS
jgi:hypothetical protein